MPKGKRTSKRSAKRSSNIRGPEAIPPRAPQGRPGFEHYPAQGRPGFEQMDGRDKLDGTVRPFERPAHTRNPTPAPYYRDITSPEVNRTGLASVYNKPTYTPPVNQSGRAENQDRYNTFMYGFDNAQRVHVMREQGVPGLKKKRKPARRKKR
jgi:hypothetical protein